MPTKQVVALIGAIMLAIGTFMPMVSVPIVGSITYVANGKGDGIIVLALALAAGACTLMRRYKPLPYLGGMALAVLAFTYWHLQRGLGDLRASADEMHAELADNLFAGLAEGLADTMVQAIQIQFGFGVILVGGILVVAAAFLPESRTPSPGQQQA